MLADTLFGHVSGAFTGAHSDRRGLVEQAAQGTLFLDEIGDIAPQMQVMLLRLLQEGEFYAVGSYHPAHSSARVIVATNRPIDTAGRGFRRDLYYRLQTHHIHLPPLRQRPEDLLLLAERFVHQAAQELNKAVGRIPPALGDVLLCASLPGNVRELQSLMYDTLARSGKDTLNLAWLKDHLLQHNEIKEDTTTPAEGPLLQGFPRQLPSLQQWEQLLITETMQRCNGNKTVAAQSLGISRQTLISRLKGAKENKIV
jgi:transcriptional regulator with PAS, ATPase and Fis domain